MTTVSTLRKRRMRRRAAALTAGMLSVATVAGASVLIQNFMAADFKAGNPPCLIKTAGEDSNDPGDDTDFEGFDFTLGTTNVDNVDLTQEKITINGLTGDRVVAEEVYVIENNCDSELTVSLVNGALTGPFDQRHLEVWLGQPTTGGGATATTTGFPGSTNTTWTAVPLEFDPAVAPATTGTVTTGTSGTVVIPAGEEVPVGMVVSTGATATGTDTATWTVQAVAP